MASFRASRFLVISALAITAAACGSDDPSSPSPSPSGGGNDGPVAATLTITSSGFSPRTVTVPVGSRVTIVNNDTRTHEMNSDPHPTHGSCPGLDNMTVTAGQSRTSQNLTTARACSLHDHADPDNALWKPTITVQ
jgi:plastocyanin